MHLQKCQPERTEVEGAPSWLQPALRAGGSVCGSRKVTAVSEAARTGQLRPSGEFSEGKQAPGLRHLLHPAPGAELSAPPAPGEQNRALHRQLGAWACSGLGCDRSAPPPPWGGSAPAAPCPHAGSLSSACVCSGLVLLICSCSRPALGFNSCCVLWHAPRCLAGYSLAITHTPTATLPAGGPQLIPVRTVLPLHGLFYETLGDRD